MVCRMRTEGWKGDLERLWTISIGEGVENLTLSVLLTDLVEKP